MTSGATPIPDAPLPVQRPAPVPAVVPAGRRHTRAPIARWVPMTTALVLGPALGVLAGINPPFAVAAMVALLCAAGFLRNGTFAVCAFTATTYVQFLDNYTGALFSPIKLTGGALIVAALLVLVQPGSALRDGAAWRRRPVIVAALAGFVAFAFASIAWSSKVEPLEYQRLATDALVFLAAGVFLQRPSQLVWMARTVLVAAGLSTILGIALGTQLFERFIGAFNDPNEYAAAMAPAIALAFLLWETTRSRVLRLLLVADVGLMLYGTMGSQSRGGVVAILAGIFVIVLTARGTERLRMLGASLVVVAGACFTLMLTPQGSAFVTKITSGDSSGRSDLWHVALNIFRANPLDGVGLGNYFVVSAQYIDATVTHAELFLGAPRVAHNTTLEILAELGIVGFTLYYAFLLGTLLTCWRALGRARRAGRTDLVRIGRGFLAATWASVASCIFLSGQYQELQWLLLAACLAYAEMVRRALAPNGPPARPALLDHRDA